MSRSLREEVMVWSVTDKDDGWDVQQALHTPLLDRCPPHTQIYRIGVGYGVGSGVAGLEIREAWVPLPTAWVTVVSMIHLT